MVEEKFCKGKFLIWGFIYQVCPQHITLEVVHLVRPDPGIVVVREEKIAKDHIKEKRKKYDRCGSDKAGC